MDSQQDTLRRRSARSERKRKDPSPSPTPPGGARVGRTFQGNEFAIPATRGPLSLRAPWRWSALEALHNLSALNLLLPLTPLPRWALAAWFLAWRAAYNVGIGLVLRWQSERQGVTAAAMAAMARGRRSLAYRALRAVACDGMGADYDFDKAPIAFTAWLPFRHLVDIVLANDLMAYLGFALAFVDPSMEMTWRNATACAAGLVLCLFALWAKSDSYRVVKDYAWYWGDFFFLIDGKLTFDRVFQIAPHPMYSIGYSFYYGCALITQSPAVLFVSLGAHFMQMLFLAWFETPHMKKIYPELVDGTTSVRNALLYDPEIGYFKRDMLGWKNFNPLRIADVAVVLLALQSAALHAAFDVPAWMCAAEVLTWRALHTGVGGYLLRRQGDDKFFVRASAQRGFTKRQAFDNWKGMFNLSHAMTVVSFVLCAAELARPTLAGYGVAQALGAALVAVGWWCYSSCYDVLGDYGWFYGDFFVDDLNIPSQLFYHGIYRFMDNPDLIIGFAGWYGVGLMAESGLVLALAAASQAAHYAFVALVERPHMERLYGDKLRLRSGISSAVQEILNYEI